MQNANSAKVEKLCSKWRKEGLGSVKRNQKADKKKHVCVFLFVWVCLYSLGRRSPSQSKISPPALGRTAPYWGPAGLTHLLTILGVSWTAGSGSMGEQLIPRGCSLWLLEMMQQILKIYFKMVQSDPKVWQSSWLSKALGFSTFQLKALRMLISRTLKVLN